MLSRIGEHSMDTVADVSFRRKLSDFPHLEELAEQVGIFIEYWGFKKIHGIIWTHLYLSKEPLSATTLTKRLKVSKALMSFSIRDLLEYDVIREFARGKGRTVLYEANPNVTEVILNVLNLREKKMLESVAQACAALQHAGSGQQKNVELDDLKVAQFQQFVGQAQNALNWIIATGRADNALFSGFEKM